MGVYWINYRVNGERFFESTETANERGARAFLAQRWREIREGTWVRPEESEEDPDEEELTTGAWLTTWVERRRAAGVQNVRDESRWVREHAIPALGDEKLWHGAGQDQSTGLPSSETCFSKRGAS